MEIWTEGIYADKHRRELKFEVSDLLYLKIVTCKGKNRGDLDRKLSPRYMDPYRILKIIGPVTYKLELPLALKAFHNVLHFSMPRKCKTNREQVIAEPPPDLHENLIVLGI